MTPIRKNKNSEKGFTLLEVMVSALVVLTAAAISMQLLLAPKEKVVELEMRAEVSRYLNTRIQEVKDMSSFPTTGIDEQHYCNPGTGTGSCNANICGNICNAYSSKCGSALTDDARLRDMISRIPSMCFVHVEMNFDCGEPVDSSEATQVCIKAEWPKKGSEYYEEALTAFLVK